MARGNTSLRRGKLMLMHLLPQTNANYHRTVLSGALFCVIDLRQQVRFGFIAHQVRITLASVIIELVGFVVAGVFDQEFKRCRSVLAFFESGTQHIRGILAAIHRDEFHSRSNSRDRCRHALDGGSSGSLFAQLKSDRVDRVYGAHVAIGPTIPSRWRSAVAQLPAAALDSAKRRPGPVIREAFSPEPQPIR